MREGNVYRTNIKMEWEKKVEKNGRRWKFEMDNCM
jgi:hypothetical protein